MSAGAENIVIAFGDTRTDAIQGHGCETSEKDYENDRELPIVLEKGRCGVDVLRIMKS